MCTIWFVVLVVSRVVEQYLVDLKRLALRDLSGQRWDRTVRCPLACGWVAHLQEVVGT